MVEQSDSELVALAQGGDGAAFARLVRRHHARLFRLALHLLRDVGEAEDVIQETFVRAHGALGRFDGRSQPFTWLYRITVNLSLNALRSRRSRKRLGALEADPETGALERAPDSAANPSEHLTDHELGTILQEGIDALSETLRTTLVLVTVEGVSLADAAAILGCPEGTVAWRVHEARRKLKEHLIARGMVAEGRSEA